MKTSDVYDFPMILSSPQVCDGDHFIANSVRDLDEYAYAYLFQEFMTLIVDKDPDPPVTPEILDSLPEGPFKDKSQREYQRYLQEIERRRCDAQEHSRILSHFWRKDPEGCWDIMQELDMGWGVVTRVSTNPLGVVDWNYRPWSSRTDT
jgi:hypothetical protein